MADTIAIERPNRLPLALLMFLVLAYPILHKPLAEGVVAAMQISAQGSIDLVRETGAWLYAGVVLAILLLWERLPVASIGLGRPGWRTILFGVGGPSRA